MRKLILLLVLYGTLNAYSVLFKYDVDMSSHYIVNLSTPVSDYGAATKKYVDDSKHYLFEVDVNGGLMPVTENYLDEWYELDGNNNIQPK